MNGISGKRLMKIFNRCMSEMAESRFLFLYGLFSFLYLWVSVDGRRMRVGLVAAVSLDVPHHAVT